MVEYLVLGLWLLLGVILGRATRILWNWYKERV